MIEYWKQIKGYEQDYMISNLGKVASIKRRGFNLMFLSDHYKGYKNVCLWKDGIRRTFYVHRLVADHFVEGKNGIKNQVNHKNFKKKDNNYKNLEWVSSDENYDHAYFLN